MVTVPTAPLQELLMRTGAVPVDLQAMPGPSTREIKKHTIKIRLAKSCPCEHWQRWDGVELESLRPE